MEFSKVRQIHKKLYKHNKENKNVYNKIFIRHWNVFYNELMKRDISVIERTCRTKLFTELVKEFGQLFGMEVPEISVHYSTDSKHYKWLSGASSVYSTLLALVEEVKKEEKEVVNE